MRIAMMGAGGIGGYVGARLAQAGDDVTFIARGAHLEAMRRNGLRLKSQHGDLTLPRVKATATPTEIGPVDIVIFAVKLYDTESAAAAMAPLVGATTRVVTLQNGVDSCDALARFVPRSQIVGGATYLSARVAEPGLIVHAGKITQVVTGGALDPVIAAWREARHRAEGIDLQTVEDVEPVLWNKFVTVSAFSGATSLMRADIGSILGDPEARVFLEQLRDEGVAVARAAGRPLPPDFAARTMNYWLKFPPETRSSMAHDVEQGRRFELAWLSGRIHALGMEHGVSTPAHTAVYRALHLHADGSKPRRRS
jgi:2-dehydropantoate 2-reductase